MSEPDFISSSSGDGEIPEWMQAVSEETYYDSKNKTKSRGEEALPSFSSRSSAAPPRSNSPAAPKGQRKSSSLEDELALSMGTPEDIPDPDPDVQPTIVGEVRADLDKQLERAVAVLATRYDRTLSRSLILEYSLHRTLTSLREDAEDSPLVRWLDSMLLPE